MQNERFRRIFFAELGEAVSDNSTRKVAIPPICSRDVSAPPSCLYSHHPSSSTRKSVLLELCALPSFCTTHQKVRRLRVCQISWLISIRRLLKSARFARIRFSSSISVVISYPHESCSTEISFAFDNAKLIFGNFKANAGELLRTDSKIR